MTTTPHWLLWQLADSAFPTGGFAHSGGLEAAWQHGEVRSSAELADFIQSSLTQAGHGALPFVTEAFVAPNRLAELDRQCDAFLSNHVANRASRAQGQALLVTVERSFGLNRHLPKVALPVSLGESPSGAGESPAPPTRGIHSIPANRADGKPPEPASSKACATLNTRPLLGHLAPVFGAVMSLLGLEREATHRLFLFITLRGLIAAAIRLGIIGPMEGQALQFRFSPQAEQISKRCANLSMDQVAQASPIVDIVHGAHDRLYSRLFQS